MARPGRRAAARLAAHAVGPPARSARPLAARHRDLRHRPWACPRRPLERPDRAATTPSRSPSIRCWSRTSSANCVPDASADARLAALLHDAPEYVIGDMISPFKSVVGGGYKAVEQRLQRAIHLRFALPAELGATLRKEIKRADQIAAYFEATLLAGFSTAEATDSSAGRAASRPTASTLTSQAGNNGADSVPEALRRRSRRRR